MIKYITQETTLADGLDRSSVPDKKILDKEKEMLEKFKASVFFLVFLFAIKFSFQAILKMLIFFQLQSFLNILCSAQFFISFFFLMI